MPRAKHKKKGRPGRPPPSRIATTSTKPSDTFNFLGLPPELRNDIYRMVFFSKESRILLVRREVNKPNRFVSYPKQTENWTSLLATNKQIRTEASGILFGSHIFSFSLNFGFGAANFKPLFKQIRKLNARNLARIIISMAGILMIDDPLAGKDGRFTCSQRSYEMIQTIKENRRRLGMFMVVIASFEITSTSPSHTNWLHLDIHGRPEMDRPRRAIPSLDRRIMAPSDKSQGSLSPKIKDRVWASGWEVYDSYSEHVEAYHDLFPPGQPDPHMLESRLRHHEDKLRRERYIAERRKIMEWKRSGKRRVPVIEDEPEDDGPEEEGAEYLVLAEV